MQRDLHDYEAIEALDIRNRLDACVALYREFVKADRAKENPSHVDEQMAIANEMCLKTLLYIRYEQTEFGDENCKTITVDYDAIKSQTHSVDQEEE